MKLKEKLASEHVYKEAKTFIPIKVDVTKNYTPITPQISAFISGFEKCRELAIEKSMNWLWEDHYLVKYDLPQLGEEEV